MPLCLSCSRSLPPCPTRGTPEGAGQRATALLHPLCAGKGRGAGKGGDGGRAVGAPHAAAGGGRVWARGKAGGCCGRAAWGTTQRGSVTGVAGVGDRGWGVCRRRASRSRSRGGSEGREEPAGGAGRGAEGRKRAGTGHQPSFVPCACCQPDDVKHLPCACRSAYQTLDVLSKGCGGFLEPLTVSSY